MSSYKNFEGTTRDITQRTLNIMNMYTFEVLGRNPKLFRIHHFFFLGNPDTCLDKPISQVSRFFEKNPPPGFPVHVAKIFINFQKFSIFSKRLQIVLKAFLRCQNAKIASALRWAARFNSMHNVACIKMPLESRYWRPFFAARAHSALNGAFKIDFSTLGNAETPKGRSAIRTSKIVLKFRVLPKYRGL